MRILDIVSADSKTVIGKCPICGGYAKLWEIIGYPLYSITRSRNLKMLRRVLDPDKLLMSCTKYKRSYPFREIRDYCFVPAGDMPLFQSKTKEAAFTVEELTMVSDHVLKPKVYLESVNSETDPKVLMAALGASFNTLTNTAMGEAMSRAMQEIEELEDANFVRFVRERMIDHVHIRRPAVSSFLEAFGPSLSVPPPLPMGPVIQEGGEIDRTRT